MAIVRKSAAAGDEEEVKAREEGARRFNETRKALDYEHMIDTERWRAKAAVLATVKVTGPRRWAHEIIALNDAGLYNCFAGLKMAQDVVGD